MRRPFDDHSTIVRRPFVEWSSKPLLPRKTLPKQYLVEKYARSPCRQFCNIKGHQRESKGIKAAATDLLEQIPVNSDHILHGRRS